MNYILFDLDGTLLNTRDGIVESIQQVMTNYGIYIDDLCLLERHIGPPLKAGFQTFYKFDEHKADEAVIEFRKIYKEKGLPGTHPYGGIQQCLNKLKRNGYHLIVATSKPEKVAKEFLEHFKMDGYFDDICGSIETLEEMRVTKAQVIDCLLNRNRILPDANVTMVGDRFHDVEGAALFNIPCVGVTYGFGSSEELVKAGAVATVSSVIELERYFIK